MNQPPTLRPLAMAWLASITVLLLAVTGSLGYVLCPVPVKDPNGGYNVTFPVNQPKWSNGTGLAYYCDQPYYTFKTFVKTPVFCGTRGQWELFGMDPTCYHWNCSKPSLSKGSQITVIGTNYTWGATIEYKCPVGWYTDEPVAVCLGPNWSNKYNPWCKLETCLDLTYGQNSSTIPYGTVDVIRLGQIDPLAPYLSWRVRQYEAMVNYTCQPGTELFGGNRTCNSSGMWSGSQALCYVPGTICYDVGDFCNAGSMVCCAWGREGVAHLGTNCCSPKTKERLGVRWSNLTHTCFTSFSDNFLPCMTQLIKCLDNKEDNSCIRDFVTTDYLYGCNSNLGDKPPQYRTNDHNLMYDDDLVKFCEQRDNRTIACTEYQSSYTGQPASQTYRTCLPRTCGDQQSDLQALAASSLLLRCTVNKNVGHFSYCSIPSLTLNCSNGMTATASQTDGACNRCPPPDNPDRTECCQFNGANMGCCLPSVNTMLQARFPSDLSPQCNASLIDGLDLCMVMIVDCLNNVRGTHMDYECPSYHTCLASTQTRQACPTAYPSGNHSLWCTTSCTYPHKPEQECQGDRFCLNEVCNSTADIHALAMSDAKLVCDFSKLTGGTASCGSAKVTWQCSDPTKGTSVEVSATYVDPVPLPLSAAAIGIIVGSTIGGLIIVGVLGVVAFHLIRRNRSYQPIVAGKAKYERRPLLQAQDMPGQDGTIHVESHPPAYT